MEQNIITTLSIPNLTEFSHQHICKEEEEEDLTDLQVCYRTRNTHDDLEPPQIKEEQQELCIKHEEILIKEDEKQIVLKKEKDAAVLNPFCDENDHSENISKCTVGPVVSEPNNELHLLHNNYHVADNRVSAKSVKVHDPAELISCNQLPDTNRDIVKCNTCGKDFNYRSKLQRHLRVHVGKSATCGMAFKISIDLTRHMRVHTEVPQQEACKGEEKVLADQRLCSQEKNCGLVQADQDPPQVKEEEEDLCISPEGEQVVLKQETDAVILTPVGGDNDQSEDIVRYIIGSVVSEAKGDLRPLYNDSHVKEKQAAGSAIGAHNPVDLQSPVSGSSSFKCFACGKDFKFLSKLQRHLKVHTGKPYVCTTCGKAFKDNDELSRHTRIHTGEKQYVCTTCRKAFKRSYELSRHVRIHTGDKPYVCNTCGKAFTQSTDLSYHVRIHTGEKPYVCTTCGKAFKQRNALSRHVRVHTGEKPYICNTCGKDFRQSANLSSHMRIHTGEKPHICKTCGKEFRLKKNLSSHMRIHTGEKPYTCKTCGKAFRQSSKLSDHLKIHTGEKPYMCNTCGKAFRLRNNLTEHVKVHTG
ncbi:unnamed protein product, partial [Tetraodon nigroviridis]